MIRTLVNECGIQPDHAFTVMIDLCAVVIVRLDVMRFKMPMNECVRMVAIVVKMFGREGRGQCQKRHCHEPGHCPTNHRQHKGIMAASYISVKQMGWSTRSLFGFRSPAWGGPHGRQIALHLAWSSLPQN